MRPSDIGLLVQCTQPRLSPDGARVAYVVAAPDVEANRYRSRIWLADTDGSRRPAALTAGDQTDANPCWSPDGCQLAFTSQRGEEPEKVSLHVIPVDGPGEVVTLTTSAEVMADLTWSPDGRWIAFTMRTRGDHYDHDDPRRRPPRRVTRFFPRLDSVGWTIDRPQHVYVVPADGSAPARNLTPGPFEHQAPAWFPTSDGLVVAGARHDTWDLDFETELFRVGLDGADPVSVVAERGVYRYPSVSPDGTSVACLGVDDAATEPQNAKVGIVDLATGLRRYVSGALDRQAAPYPGARAPGWDGDGLLFSAEDRGRVSLFRVAVDGASPPELVLGGDRVVTGWSAAAGTLAVAVTTFDRPAEVHVVRDGHERRISSATDAFVDAVRPRLAERFTAPSGSVEVDAWILPPADLVPGRRYPMLLNIHGGPHTQYGDRFFDEFHLQAAAGFVVLCCNPRGSSGREQAWGRAIAGPRHPTDPGAGWGSVDADDILAVADEAIRRYPFVDPDRLGVLGGSYGGYLTSWLVGHTTRFRAACSERAVNNLLTLEWTSDIATAFRTEVGVGHLEAPEEYLRVSPITYVRNIETPLLIIHSEDDLRCPISQAEELFTAMRLLGKDVEFLRFPGESHELSRAGSPVHRVQRAEAILDFFGRHLRAADDDEQGH